MKIFRYIISLLIVCGLFSSCGVYSFTGASISPDIQTLSIQTFFNNANLGPSNMSQLFTEAIKNYYQQNTSLALVVEDGDLQFDGAIESYTLSPVAPTASNDPNGIDFSTLTRITVNVRAEYINTKDDTFNFERRFSFFKDFDQTTTDISAVEEAFVEEIFEQIIIDIFNASVANW